MKERFPTSQQENFSSGHAAASNADEEIEEGEIVTTEETFSCSSKGAVGLLESAVVPVVAPTPDCIENGMISNSSHRLPQLSSVTDVMQLDQSVRAIFPLPGNAPQQGQSRSDFPRLSLSGGRFQASPPAKKEESVSFPSKSTQIPSAVAREPSLQTSSPNSHHRQLSSPNLPHGNPPESLQSILLHSNDEQLSMQAVISAESDRFEQRDHQSSPGIQPLVFLQSNEAPLSVQASIPAESNRIDEKDHQSSPNLRLGTLGSPHESLQPLVILQSNEAHLNGLSVITAGINRIVERDCQSSPNLPHGALGNPQESQPLEFLQSSEAQLSGQAVTSAESSKVDERAFISCANGKRRPRSSAVRDYPEGCGRRLCATSNWELAEPAFPDEKVSLPMTVAKGRSLSAGSSLIRGAEQGKRKQNVIRPSQGKWVIGVTSRSIQRSCSRLEDQTALLLYKSMNERVLPIQRQTVQDPLPHKHENQTSSDYSLETAPKKLKVRPLPRVLSCTETLPHLSEERSTQSRWVLEDELLGQDHSIRAVKPANPQARPRLQKPSKKIVSFISQNLKGLENAQSSCTDCGASSRFQVKRTLQEFDCVRRSLASGKERSFRPDLAAAQILKRKGRWRNCDGEKIVGHVPGVEVGDQFSFRIEMLIVGLHRQVQGGIDYMSASVRPKGPLATSIVASGGYEDDDDYGATFIYTGQGGNNYKTDRRQGKDQVLKRGNLALSNSFKERTPVRVIRGSTDDKFYTYDGLYNVIDCWFQTGVAGFGVYQYKLSRRSGQPELVSSIVKFMGIVKKRGLARPHLLLGDLSRGKERLPVSVVNEVDGEAVPEFFTYIPKMKYPSWYHVELSRGCDCVGGCVDASKCLCAAKNGGEFPYNEIGQIVRDKKVVFECGKSCACSSSCYNRVSQKGLKYQLEVFKTRKRGWGVRSLEPIRPGDFICEYAGELLSDADAERRTGCDEYLFDIGHRTNAWMDVSDLIETSKGKAIVPVVEDEGFTIDARLFGSVARFINHSCSPNLYAQDVVYDSDDLRFPHVMLFAMENTPPMRELSYDYNYSIGHVRDANGDVKSKACYCEAQDCRGRLY